MKKLILNIILVISVTAIFAQANMRSVEELTSAKEPGWAFIQRWIELANNKVEILTCDSIKAKDALYKCQVTVHSPMGAVIYSTGGILIDDGWIRILGSGNTKLNRTLPDWNKGKSFIEFGEKPSFLLIADDAIGGFFAINQGKFGKDLGSVYYLSPDNLKWISLKLSYADFLGFCFFGNLDEFYKSLRWPNWNEEIPALDGNQVYTFYPYLWTREGKDINKNLRKIIPVEEQYSFNSSMRMQLGLVKKG